MVNNKGFSLVEVLVAVGIMSIMSFFMMDMISNQNKAIKTTQYTMDLNEAQNQIQRFMLDSDICRNSLAGYSFPQNVEVPIVSIKRDATTVLLSKLPPNNKVGGIEIESLAIKRKPSPLDKELELLVRFSKTTSGNSYGGDQFLRKVGLSAQFDPAVPNNIKNCFSQLDNAVATSLQLACKEFCPLCTFDSVNLKCVRPPGSSYTLYKNRNTGAITSTATPTSSRKTVCLDGGGNAGNAQNAAKNKCWESGGDVADSGWNRGGCSSGGKSYTGWAECRYTYDYLGTLNP